jgi:glycosyltransferase involved in cell wall biosynthesis
LPKRIAFLLPNLTGGGAERVALALMSAFLERQIEVDLVVLEARGELLDRVPPGAHMTVLGTSRIRSAIMPFAAYLRDRRPDAVEASMWPLTLVPFAARLLSGVSTRIIISDHAILSEAYRQSGWLHRLFLRASIGFAYPWADVRVAVSQGVADDLAALGGIDRSAIDVVYNPLVLPSGQQGGTEPNWGGEGARILAVGTLKPVKNHELLLQAFARVASKRPARLMILGEGSNRPTLEGLADRLGIADRVSMPGSMVDLAPFYRSANVFALSSDNEGFGNVLVEAMHHGLTVVSTNCPTGPSEILDDGRFGYLTPCGDVEAFAEAIDRACDQPFPPGLLKDRAEALSGPHVIDQYLALLLPELAR